MELARVLLGNKVGGTLVVEEAESLAVTADKDFAVARVDLGSGEGADFSPISILVSDE